MWHPFQLIPAGLPRWIVFGMLFILGTAVMLKVTAPFKDNASKSRAIDLEFAGSKTKAEEVIHSLDKENIRAHLRWDNLYIVLYALWISLCCVMSASSSAKPLPESFYLFLAWCPFVAGILDYVENYSIYLMLSEIKDDTLPQIAFWTASIKFLLLGSCGLFVLIELLMWVSSKVYSLRYSS